MNATTRILLFIIISLWPVISCKERKEKKAPASISAIDLKRGDIISCGPSALELGSLRFTINCDASSQADFLTGLKLLHSFEYDEAEKAFAKVIDQSPDCAMAYWGIAMANFHPLWTPPAEAELVKGSKAIAIANSIPGKSLQEMGYIRAVQAYYKDWEQTQHPVRCINFEKAMAVLCQEFPDDKEAAIFHALAMVAAASPMDKKYVLQKAAADILKNLQKEEPNHPGIIHYIIHSYDYPELAALALPAARSYARIAPSSAHALHMPSHIFTRLGLWDESIQSNRQSIAAAKCYAEASGIGEHWDEELHGMDYLVYAYLQKGDNSLAREQLDYLYSFTEVNPLNFKVAYAFASIPSRILLENKDWEAARQLSFHPIALPWTDYPWQKAIIHFTRALGAAHVGNDIYVLAEIAQLQQLHDTLLKQKDDYKANQVAILWNTAIAWKEWKFGQPDKALSLMKRAAEMEDSTEKHPVTPGEVLPARELLADMQVSFKQFDAALLSYEAVLKNRPGRFNSLYGAAMAAEKVANKEKANLYYRELLAIAGQSDRPELSRIPIDLKQ